MNDSAILLSEKYVQDCFHSYLKSALTQAKAERLLDTEVLSSAEGDLMITGPALCLYFAALRSTTNPPSVPMPRLSKSGSPPTDLTLANCPVPFRPFLTIWSQAVPGIQNLTPEHQHDLARLICGLSSVSHPPNPNLPAIAADLRAVAIEISMRRTFQDRYAMDLQAAIDAGRPATHRVKASFVPPPVYEATSPTSSTLSLQVPSMSPSASTSSFRTPSPLPSPTILGPDSPAIEFIRETLYAALADVLERQPPLRQMLARDPPRAYFAAVAFAILDVSRSSVSLDGREPTIRGVLGKELALSECPKELRPFMEELCKIGVQAREVEEDDTLVSVQALSRGKTLPTPRMERVKEVLKGGVGWVYDSNHERDGDSSLTANGRHSHSHTRHSPRSSEFNASPQSLDTLSADPRRRTTSVENRAVSFANRINALALSMTKLKAFRERQDIVFKVLVGVAS